MLGKPWSGRTSRAVALLGCLVMSGGLAQGAVLFSGTISLSSTDPTQLGTLDSDFIIPNWAVPKSFPGTINSTTSYHYEAIPVVVPNWLSFLQISIDSNNLNIYASVYDTSYHPDPLAPNNGLDINYMGDEGLSGNFFGNPAFFQVVDHTAANSPSGFGTAIIVLNETVPNGGLNSPVGVVVEGFSDTSFNAVPEPVTATLLCAGALMLALRSRYSKLAAK